jgi:Carbohydrate-selective porin, OprB family/S-layer homology domain
MYKYVWHMLLLNAVVLFSYGFELAPAIASEPTQDAASTSAETSLETTHSLDTRSLDMPAESATGTASSDESLTPSFDDLSRSNLDPAIDPAIDLDSSPMAQVTSVSQLSDVQPTDWAFQALQNLVERYGCIAGYPDGTYRGRQATTRYEFAAGLNACLDRVNELIAAGLADAVTSEDLATVQRLQEEFAAELAALRGRVDSLEARTAELEANQFSTTTVLRGLTWFNLTGAFADGSVQVETADLSDPPVLRAAGRDPATGRPLVQEVDDDPELTFSYLTWLTLQTSFTGSDSLVTQLAVGNGDSPANVFASAGLYNTFGTPFTDQTAGPDVGSSDVILRELFYSFPVTDSIQATVGPRINWYRYFDNNRFTFFLNGTNTFNSGGSTLLNTIDRGSGAVVQWQINDAFRLGVAYLGESDEFLPNSLFNSASNPKDGLFGGTNTLTAELVFSPSSDLNIRLLYNHSNINAIFGQVGGAIGEPVYGVLDDGNGGPLNDATADAFNINFDWLVTEGIGLFGRYTYGTTHIEPGDLEAQAFQAGIAFLDFLKEGSQLTLSYMVPFSVLDGGDFLVAGGGDGGVQYEFEATYYYPITDNIALVPAFYIIGNANNFDSNPTIYVGNLRTQFSF